jgi:hypothetical protein
MDKKPLTLEHALYALALALAAGLRLPLLGSLPLSNAEAAWALQALNLAHGLHPAIGPNPAYVQLTAATFYLFGASNFLARFWPALAGTLLVLAPWFVRRRIGRIPALLLAFGLAIDPGLNALSHLAGGPMLAIACLIGATVFWLDRHRSTAGLFAGLALLSGSSVWLGLLGLGLVGLIARAFPLLRGGQPEQPSAGRLRPTWQELRPALIWCLGTMLVLGSLFLLSPQGIAAFAGSIPAFLTGWWTFSSVPLWRTLLAIPAYELLPLIFGLVGLVRAALTRNRLSLLLGIWALVALVLVALYPGQQTPDLGWSILPLWTLTALELAHHLDFKGQNAWALAAVMTLMIVLVIFGWLDLASITTMDLSTSDAKARLLLLAGVFLVAGLSLFLIGTGWSASLARLGGVWSVVLLLTLWTIAYTTGAGGQRQPRTLELWQADPRTDNADVVLEVANQISSWNTGQNSDLPLAIVNVDSPALVWLFRDWPVSQVSVLGPKQTPQMIITPGTVTSLNLSAAYRGEPLAWQQQAGWSTASASDWLNWLVYRQMPMQNTDIVLWVRSDLTIDNQGAPATSP